MTHQEQELAFETNQNLRDAATNIREACAIATATGNSVEFDDDALAEFRQAVERLKNDCAAMNGEQQHETPTS